MEDLLEAFSPEVIADMRAWIADCPWADLVDEDVAGLTPEQVLRGVREHYDGGIFMFLAGMVA
jgi:hypothetical protein